MSGAGLTAALKKRDDDYICFAINRELGNIRWLEFAKRDATSRGLGDCSDDHRKYIDIGFPVGSDEYRNCRVSIAAGTKSRPQTRVIIKK